MAGHSHWAQIKRQKGANDAKRGQLFSKISREITVAARMGGGDPSFNPRLRSAIQTAKAESMPADNIERAVKKGLGELEGTTIEEILYEGYAPGGVALLVEAATDNKNRTAADVRRIFSKNNGNLGGSGSVAWMFKRKCLFLVSGATEDAVMEATLDAGVEDVNATPEGIEVVGPMEQFDALHKALDAAKIEIAQSKLTYLPSNTTHVADEETARQMLHLMEALDEYEDVQNVYANYELAADLEEKLATL